MKVYIEGEIRNRKWEKEGVNYNRTEIRADNMMVLTPLSKNVSVDTDFDSNEDISDKNSKSASKKVKDVEIEELDSLDDLPF